MAVGGAYTLAVGDSNTNGFGDRYATDNRLVSRILGTQGYGGTLADRLDTMAPFNVVYNEGISGDTADKTRYVRLGSLLERHSLARRALVSLGTNDISGGRDSGESCGAGDDACLADTIRGDIQAIVDELDQAGPEVWTATVPPAWPRGTPSPTSDRMLATQEVNRAIRNGIDGDNDGPDLFDLFYTDTDTNGVPDVARLSLYSDRFHYNGCGHHIVALLWYNPLIGDATGTAIAPFYLSEPNVWGNQQNLLDPGYDLRFDDFETVDSFPAEFADGIWVMTAQADAGRTANSFLSFSEADRPVDVYLAYDASATVLPAWLTGSFSEVAGATIATSDGSYQGYVRSYSAGQTIPLGSNAANGADAGLMYIPVVVDTAAP